MILQTVQSLDQQLTSILNKLGLLYLVKGNFPRSVEFLEKSLAVMREYADQTLSRSKLINTVVSGIQNATEWEPDRMLASMFPDANSTLFNLGLAYRQMGDYNKSEENLMRSLNALRTIGRDRNRTIYDHSE